MTFRVDGETSRRVVANRRTWEATADALADLLWDVWAVDALVWIDGVGLFKPARLEADAADRREWSDPHHLAAVAEGGPFRGRLTCSDTLAGLFLAARQATAIRVAA